ncbi:DUF1682-domain-containing protein [Nadsonia fulvescens var. elongata DSM 6958]|uniref:DUF1682-domain-containing protein n=1 Tax=Nadsonia fulvescens var. elongata DSM 6958 TaxID=857566 RepID=A0A1E3PIY9_9ASCO|nr:DUF1682-domain-containing protein [Nadsonia fulvescens var. elongata DSM 6958]
MPVNDEWTDIGLLGRITTYNWKSEIIIVGLIAAYVCLHYFGVSLNQKKADAWFASHEPTLAKQFYQVGVTPVGAANQKHFEKDSPTEFSTYATGRVNIANFIARIELKGRHNLVVLALEYIISFFFTIPAPVDRVEIRINPSNDAQVEDFIFAVVNKDGMNDARQDNYYLSLTRTSDSDKLPINFVFMSESAEITETVFSRELKAAVKGAENVLEYLAITDLPVDRPNTLEGLKPQPRIILKTKLPTTEEEYKVSSRIIEAALNLVDSLASKAKWRPEVAKKIMATREAETKKIQKTLDAAKAEELAAKKLEAKKEQAQQSANLSPEAQRKAEQKRKEKEQRKLKSKQSKRM